MQKTLHELWMTGVKSVQGYVAVRENLDALPANPDRIIAVGKAACDMVRPAMERFPNRPTLVVTKHGHTAELPGSATIIEAGHPIPDSFSLAAGAALLEAVNTCAPNDHLLILVSGGASAVAEVLPSDMTLTDWQTETQAMMASGADIHALNTRRREISRVKNGKLLAGFKGARATTLAISDVEGDALEVIGSGIGCAPPDRAFDFASHIVASNAIARAAIQSATDETVVINDECLYENVTMLAPKLGAQIKNGPSGLYIFGGEPTVLLPDNPGRGGRNQALALMLAQQISGMDTIEILVAGTDGTDGPTPDAGGIVDGQTWTPEGTDALKRADAGTFLEKRNALVTTGPTGTNVMDILIARKS